MIRVADYSGQLPPLPPPPLTNEQIAHRLDEVAELLEHQEANAFRVQAYRTAAQTVRFTKQPVHEIIAEHGLAGLRQLPGIGESLARTIEELALMGRLTLLEHLRGEGGAEEVFTTVPGLGREFARRIHELLGIETLTDLEIAAYDGRLAKVPGIGPRRLRAIRESLAGRFRRRPRMGDAAADRQSQTFQPPVDELLDIDAEYRRKAQANQLRLIAPRRFNPSGESWLPVLHTQRDDRHYTALFSNTARAHELQKTHDWVVIYRDDSGAFGQWTVVTAHRGELSGKRIVRGREAESRQYYEATTNR